MALKPTTVAPTVCLATLGALALIQLAADREVPLFTLYGVVVNGLWLYVVKSRGSRPEKFPSYGQVPLDSTVMAAGG